MINKNFQAAYLHTLNVHFVTKAFDAKIFKNIKQTSVLNVHTAVTTATIMSLPVKMSSVPTGQSALPGQYLVLISVVFIQSERL
jgi:hypothetical protein